MDAVRRSLVVFGLAWVVGCRPPIITGSERRALRALKIDQAEADAAKAMAAGDRRLLSVGGIAITIPGTRLAGGELDTKRERFLEGTGDLLHDNEHSRLNRNAYRYAERYNREIIRLGGYTPAEQAILEDKAHRAKQEANKT